LYIIFSIILEKEGIREKGLELEILVVSAFLNKGLISEYFSLSGNTPVEGTSCASGLTCYLFSLFFGGEGGATESTL